jgi:hypothetical protein
MFPSNPPPDMNRPLQESSPKVRLEMLMEFTKKEAVYNNKKIATKIQFEEILASIITWSWSYRTQVQEY